MSPDVASPPRTTLSSVRPSLAIPRDREQRLEALLRLGVAMCFIGHGAFGIVTKAAWLPYFSLLGIPSEAAYRLMPVVGAVDVAVGLCALVAPTRPVLLYAAAWALWTALLRPLAGEGAWEALERAGNYGVPLALLVAAGADRGRGWMGRLRVPPLSPSRRLAVLRVLQWTTALLLIGHGALGLLERKPVLVQHWSLLGLPARTVALAGALEIALGLLVLLRPGPRTLVFACGWKVATELLYPLSGEPVWEFVERGGSFVAPLAAALLWRDLARSAPLPAGRRTGALARAVALAGLALGIGTARAEAQAPQPGLLDRLHRGGLVIACRHAITDHQRPDPVSGQRILSDEGREQARRLGAAVRAAGIPIGPVFSSPALRTLESARLSFGDVQADEALTTAGAESRRRQLFSDPVRERENRVLVTHQGILRRMLPRYGRGPIDEGDCLVLRPGGGEESIVLARVTADGWSALRE